MTENTAVMLTWPIEFWICEPTQTANSGAPVHMLIVQSAAAVTSPTFFTPCAIPTGERSYSTLL